MHQWQDFVVQLSRQPCLCGCCLIRFEQYFQPVKEVTEDERQTKKDENEDSEEEDGEEEEE